MLENLKFFKILQEFPTFIMFFQLSNFLEGLGPGWGPGQAQAWPGTLQKVGKLEKHHKSWKFLEIIGNSWKIEGFPTFFVEKVGKPTGFQYFLMFVDHGLP